MSEENAKAVGTTDEKLICTTAEKCIGTIGEESVANPPEEGKKVNEEKVGSADHWLEGVERLGLGEFWYRANHIALVVSNIGESLAFYTGVLGAQQIRRPNFDRHGAWLTLGNIELHLIKGKPAVHSGDDLIVSHIALECSTDRMLDLAVKLKEMQLDFRINVSVPKAHQEENFEKERNSSIVEQFFLRDPDGYYLEMCNCDILTKFCLGKEDVTIQYKENFVTIMNCIAKTHAWSQKAKKKRSVVEVDEKKIANLVRRSNVYGDALQGQSEERLRYLMARNENNIPQVLKVLYDEQEEFGGKMIPPAFFNKDEERVQPPALVNTFHERTPCKEAGGGKKTTPAKQEEETKGK